MKSSLDTRYKTELVSKFIELLDLNKENTKESISSDFYEFAKKEKEEAIEELICSENLEDDAKRFIKKCIKKGSIENVGDQLDKIIGKVSRRGGKRTEKKLSVVQKINDLISIFVGV